MFMNSPILCSLAFDGLVKNFLVFTTLRYKRLWQMVLYLSVKEKCCTVKQIKQSKIYVSEVYTLTRVFLTINNPESRNESPEQVHTIYALVQGQDHLPQPFILTNKIQTSISDLSEISNFLKFIKKELFMSLKHQSFWYENLYLCKVCYF